MHEEFARMFHDDKSALAKADCANSAGAAHRRKCTSDESEAAQVAKPRFGSL